MPASPKAQGLETTIDRYGELDTQIQQFAPVVAEHKRLKKEIESWYESLPAGQPQLAKGARYTIQLGARENERTVVHPGKAFAALKKAVGSLDAAVALVTIPFGAAIDKFIPKSLHPSFVVEERTGSRTFKCVRNDV